MASEPDTQPVSGPADVATPSRLTRLATSWKLWAVALVLGLLGIGVSLAMPLFHRQRALRYFDNHPGVGEYELSDKRADWTQRYGEWVNGLREVDSLHAIVDDNALRHVGALHDAISLKLATGRPITSAGLDALPPFERLRELSLVGPGFTDEAVARLLAARTPLSDVCLFEAGGRLTLEALCETSVTELTITSRTLTDNDFRDLPPLQGVNRLAATGLGDHGAQWLASCPELTEVVAVFSPMTDVGLHHLKKGINLDIIYLHGAMVTPNGVADLLQSTNLSSFGVLSCPHLTADDVAEWPILPDLEDLALSADLLTDASVARLREMPELRRLEIHGIIATPELRRIVDEHWRLDEEEPLTDELIWLMLREVARDW